jgi:hypothetical protein
LKVANFELAFVGNICFSSLWHVNKKSGGGKVQLQKVMGANRMGW